MAINESKMQAFMEKAISDIGAGMSAALVLIGDRLGLYKALASSGPLTSAELAQKTETAERYIREWLGNQTAGGYILFDPETNKYMIPEEQAMALANESSPAFIPGAFQIIAAMFHAAPQIEKNFKTGQGLDWCDHHSNLFEGIERFFRPNYLGHLLNNWIPSLNGVEKKLKEGALVADIGCGLGSSTIIMAQAFPESKFVGIDYHDASIEIAKDRAQKAGVGSQITFTVATSTDYPGKDYDLITCFDCLHDMGDPIGTARYVKETLRQDGIWMIVEPFAGDKVEENLTPIGRTFYAASTCFCVPSSLAHNGPALGAQAGEARLRQILLDGGFTKIRRTAETPFNLVLEAKL